MRSIATPLAVGLVLLAASACKGIAVRPQISERVERIERARLEEHVLALDAIGPRPVGDAGATRAAVEYLTDQLTRLGYDVQEEPVEVVSTGTLIARVHPLDQPQAEPVEIPLGATADVGHGAAIALASGRLKQEGWVVETILMRSDGPPVRHAAPNVIAEKRGTSRPERVVELAAHYDTVAGSPGADDNSSGVAALLEVARVVADVPTAMTLRFCFFGAEEVGLHGSRAHVKRLVADPHTELEALIDLDAVGRTAHGPGTQREPDGVPWFLFFPDEADFVAVVGEWSTGWLGNLFEAAIDAYAPELAYYSANRIGSFFPDAKRSDHASYWDADLPAIFVTDTGEFRTDTYHQPSDTPDTLDYAFLESVTRATAAAALHCAEIESR